MGDTSSVYMPGLGDPVAEHQSLDFPKWVGHCQHREELWAEAHDKKGKLIWKEAFLPISNNKSFSDPSLIRYLSLISTIQGTSQDPGPIWLGKWPSCTVSMFL